MKKENLGERGTYAKIPSAVSCDVTGCNCNAAYDTVTTNGLNFYN